AGRRGSCVPRLELSPQPVVRVPSPYVRSSPEGTCPGFVYSLRMSSGNPLSPASLLRALPRAVDDRPLWAQLNITWRCNLDCSYCTEYDNAKDHVPFDDVARSIDKVHALGGLPTDLMGGEPLLHPDLLRLLARISGHGMTT